ncbi:MAG: glycosyltransferase family 39 protein [Rhodospirillales bacterium]|nr:glycosyltransferase family 39 protein [Rhodospirillales bacterium]MDE2197561.1 glycosyltransferase family 39 protein [Rhodospirillales bacterium]MDE2573983.1 glycosyltransferase family 39 protein [Rhodospirillales bacterium]
MANPTVKDTPRRDRSDPPFCKAELASDFGLCLLAMVVLYWRWVGYQGHDDASYAAAALTWVQHFPSLGNDHWALRYPLVLPIAGAIALFGPSVAALTTVNLSTFVGYLVVSYLAVRHWFGRTAAILLTVIGILLPEFPVQATYANPDLPEMAFVIFSFWTLMLARERGGGWKLMLLSGFLAGIGFLTRETTALLVIFYGLLFLFRPAMPRWQYFLIGLGFTVVIAAQVGYLTVRTGDPLYRFNLDAHHDTVNRSTKEIAAERAGRALDSEGVLATNPIVAPLAAIFISQKFGLLFFLAIPSCVVLLADRRLTVQQRSVVACAGLGALVAFLFVALNVTILYVVPRYFIVPAALAAVPTAVLGARLLNRGGFRMVVAILAGTGFVASSVGLLYLEDTHPMRAEQQIVRFIATSNAPVHVDPETARRLRYLLIARGLTNRMTISPPGAGSLVATEDGVVQACLKIPHCQIYDSMEKFSAGPGWTVLTRYDPPTRAIATVLRYLRLDTLIPPDILKKIDQPGTTAIIYRVAG